MSSIYYYGQDGTPVTDELIKLFDLGPKEYRYSDCQGKNIFDFVFNMISAKKPARKSCDPMIIVVRAI